MYKILIEKLWEHPFAQPQARRIVDGLDFLTDISDGRIDHSPATVVYAKDAALASMVTQILDLSGHIYQVLPPVAEPAAELLTRQAVIEEDARVVEQLRAEIAAADPQAEAEQAAVEREKAYQEYAAERAAWESDHAAEVAAYYTAQAEAQEAEIAADLNPPPATPLTEVDPAPAQSLPLCKHCGKPFETRRKNNEYCYDPECQRAKRIAYQKAYKSGRRAAAGPSDDDLRAVESLAAEALAEDVVTPPVPAPEPPLTEGWWQIMTGEDAGKRMSEYQVMAALENAKLDYGGQIRHAMRGMHKIVADSTGSAQKLVPLNGNGNGRKR